MLKSRSYTITTLIFTYMIIALLLNSVGVVILQSMNFYGISKPQASVLEGFKDLPIAITSFLIASQLPKIGYKRGLLISMAAVIIGCLAILFLDSFWGAKVHFLLVGISFGVAKVALYSSVGLITSDSKQHASMLNMIEGFFVIGILSGYWVFGAFINNDNPTDASWLNVYWLLIALCAIAIAMLLTMSLDESDAKASNDKGALKSFLAMLKFALRPVIIFCVLSLFLYVVIEQSIGTWLPTFNNEILHLPTKMSIQAASIFAASLAAGRLFAGLVLTRVNWFIFVAFCLVGVAAIIMFTLPLTKELVLNENVSWTSAPLVVYLLPMVGFFMGPIYPIVSSIVLSSLPKFQHAPVTGLIVIGSALGGTIGSLITGRVFENFDGQTAFYLTLVPLIILLLSLFILRARVNKAKTNFPS